MLLVVDLSVRCVWRLGDRAINFQGHVGAHGPQLDPCHARQGACACARALPALTLLNPHSPWFPRWTTAATPLTR